MKEPSGLRLLARKLRSAVIIAGRTAGTFSRKTHARLLHGVEFVGTASVGTGVRFRVTDGGRIRIGDGVHIGEWARITAQGGVLEIGDDCFIGPGSELIASERVSIGRDCLIAAGCIVLDFNHRFDDPDRPIRLQGNQIAPVHVGENVWLGSYVVVTAGSSIGEGCVVGANSVVRGTLPARAVAAGAPAVVRRMRRANETNPSADEGCATSGLERP